MNREEIKQFLPHREPMLLVDEMIFNEDGTVVGKYHVRGDEFFLQGHYPGNPVVPGVILCEIMGQSCSLLVKEYLQGKTPYFTGIDKTRFKRPVYPGDTIEVTVYRFASNAFGGRFGTTKGETLTFEIILSEDKGELN